MLLIDGLITWIHKLFFNAISLEKWQSSNWNRRERNFHQQGGRKTLFTYSRNVVRIKPLVYPALKSCVSTGNAEQY